MTVREIEKEARRIMARIDSCEKQVELGVISPELARLNKDLKKIQSKCPHLDSYTFDGKEYCEICQKLL